MSEIFTERTELLLGAKGIQRLSESRVAVFGIGGVGGYVAEALARAGVGKLDLIDPDIIRESNLNRQIWALRSTVGKPKADVAKERLLDINPDLEIYVHKLFFLPENADSISFKDFDYVVDAIDTVSGKMAIILEAKKAGVPMISSMGTGNKLDPSRLTLGDLFETEVCPLARVMRQLCRKNGVTRLKVLYSKEPPRKCSDREEGTVGSVPFVPPVAGLMIASEVIKDLLK